MAKGKGRAPSAYNKCVGKEMKGRHFKSADAARSAMKAAAKKCAR